MPQHNPPHPCCLPKIFLGLSFILQLLAEFIPMNFLNFFIDLDIANITEAIAMSASYSTVTDCTTPAIRHVGNCNLISLGFPSDPEDKTQLHHSCAGGLVSHRSFTYKNSTSFTCRDFRSTKSAGAC